MKRWIVAVAALAVPAHASAQEAIRIEPNEAMQCAEWASALSEFVPDEETKVGLLYALSYFVGQYEGASGRSIKDGHDEALVTWWRGIRMRLPRDARDIWPSMGPG